VTPATRRVREARLAFEPEVPPRRLSPSQFDALVAVSEVLRPPYPRPTAREIAQEIDARLAASESDGWRYAPMPPDDEAYARGLDRLASEFAKRAPAAVVETLAAGALGWPDVDARRFFEELLVEVVEIAYSHPVVQDAIGYDGFADAQGWTL
jgi:hypothetical protein